MSSEGEKKNARGPGGCRGGPGGGSPPAKPRPGVVRGTGLAHKIFFILSLNLLLSSMNKVELS